MGKTQASEAQIAALIEKKASARPGQDVAEPTEKGGCAAESRPAWGAPR